MACNRLRTYTDSVPLGFNSNWKGVSGIWGEGEVIGIRVSARRQFPPR